MGQVLPIILDILIVKETACRTDKHVGQISSRPSVFVVVQYQSFHFSFNVSMISHVDLCGGHGHADGEPDESPGCQDHVHDLVERRGPEGQIPEKNVHLIEKFWI